MSAGHPSIRVELEQKFDYWGEPIMWVHNPEYIVRAIEILMAQPDNPVYTALASIGVSEGLESILFHHWQEGDFQIIFRVDATSRGAEPVSLCLLLAKDGGEVSEIVDTECRNLSALSERHPAVITPLGQGELEMLDAESGGVEFLSYYVTPWLPDFHELGVNKEMNFFVNEEPFHDFSRAETDQLKRDMIEICLSLYDVETRTGIEPPLIGAGDFMVTRPVEGEALRLRLIASGPAVVYDSLDACLTALLEDQGEWGDQAFSLRPSDAALISDAAVAALSGMDAEDVNAAVGRVLQLIDGAER